MGPFYGRMGKLGEGRAGVATCGCAGAAVSAGISCAGKLGVSRRQLSRCLASTASLAVAQKLGLTGGNSIAPIGLNRFCLDRTIAGYAAPQAGMGRTTSFHQYARLCATLPGLAFQRFEKR